jgi:hypothetical protein
MLNNAFIMDLDYVRCLTTAESKFKRAEVYTKDSKMSTMQNFDFHTKYCITVIKPIAKEQKKQRRVQLYYQWITFLYL